MSAIRRSLEIAATLAVLVVLFIGMGFATVQVPAAAATLAAAPVNMAKPESARAEPLASTMHSTSCGPDWTVVASPNASAGENVLNGVSALTTSDVWAVGYSDSTSVRQTLIEHWDGTAWSVVTSPSPGTSFNNLTGVAAIAGNDVWAVGSSQGFTGSETLIEHWDGTTWSVVTSPSPGTYNNNLSGVSALSGSDIWAVGSYSDDGNLFQTLTMHWNGAVWSIVASPNAGDTSDNILSGVAAIASNDVWAVGSYSGGETQTLTMHWNGSAWSIVASPNVNNRGILNAVSAESSSNVWAVGFYTDSSDLSQTLALHWNGTVWSVIPTPNGTGHNSLLGVVTVSSADVWAVGYVQSHTLVEHWDGATWNIVPSPNVNESGFLTSVSTLPSGEVWAVGHYGSSGYRTLVEQYNPCIASPTPSVTGTPPTATPTYTGTPPTATGTPPTATGTPTTATTTSTPTSTVTSTPTITPTQCSVRFEQISSPNSGTGPNSLNAVAVVSANDVWAVGSYLGGSGGRTLIEHWNGTEWSIVASPSPNTGPAFINLTGVAAVSASDVWAVGYYSNGSVDQTLILHWNGTAWSIVASPNTGTSFNQLLGVAALSSSDVWAVGQYFTTGGSATRTLTMHWNGTAWNIVPSPSPGADLNMLSGVAAASSSDVWAVGNYENGSVPETLTMHWNGTTWSVVNSPNASSFSNRLNGVDAVSANDVWAVGDYENGSVHQTLTEHWNGSTWSIMPSPNVGYDNTFYAVTAVSAYDVWAVGYSDSAGFLDHVLTEHWLGSTWSIVPNSLDSNGDRLYGAAAVSANDVWAVGEYVSGSVPQTLVERYKPCPVAGTPTPVPTACPLQFTDVPEGSTFYAFVRCLACRGIVSGYSDGTFRPNSNVTRGQLSKIVSNAAGYSEPAGTQMFEDVAPGSTFYDYIQRLASRSFINGYACGSAGEPCGGGNLPYFRPNSNATRGQISKIVSNAAGYSEPAGTQMFEDVAPGSTFYDYVQRLAFRTIINGYLCGLPGEPCGPGNLPYFRPNSNATRGQTSKIVANAFFPNCQTPQTYR